MKTFRYIRNGYVAVYFQGMWVAEHRLVWAAAHGPIPDRAHIHHKNGDRADNRLENLEMMQIGQHISLHHTKPKVRCIEDGCERKATKRHFCDVHYVTHFRKEKVAAYAKRRYHANLEERRRYARGWYRRKAGTRPEHYLRPD